MTDVTIVESVTTVSIAEPVSVTVTTSGEITGVTIVEAAASAVSIIEPVTMVTIIEGVPAPDPVEPATEFLFDFSDAENSMYLGAL